MITSELLALGSDSERTFCCNYGLQRDARCSKAAALRKASRKVSASIRESIALLNTSNYANCEVLEMPETGRGVDARGGPPPGTPKLGPPCAAPEDLV